MYNFGLQINEKQYRNLKEPSYSLLSDLEKEGPFCLSKPKVDISKEEPIIIGSIVDKYLTDRDNIGKIIVLDKVPSEKPMLIVEKIIDNIALFPEPLDVFNEANHKLIMAYCDEFEYYKNKETRLKYLAEFKKYIEVHSMPIADNTTIMTSYQRDQAMRVVNAVKQTFPVFNQDKGLGQLKLYGIINGLKLKVMFDMVLVDTENKVLLPFDLKTGTDNYSEFPKGNFVKYNYYLQGALYKEVLAQNLQGSMFEGYKIAPFRFLYCSRTELLPMIFKMTDEMHTKALNGFYSGGKYKKGLFQLIDEYKYYIDNPSNLYRKDFIKVNNKGAKLLEYDL